MDEPEVALRTSLWGARLERAAAARRGQPVAAIDERLGALEAALADRRRPPSVARALASRLGLSPVDVELLWCVVAVAIDPVAQRAADELTRGRARRGVPVALFAEVAGLDARAVEALATSLARGHALVRSRLVEQVEGEVPAAAALAPTPRLLAHLVGDDTPAPPLRRVVVPPAQRASYLFDLAQAETLAAMAELLAPGSRVLVVLEGPERSGRTTATAFAAGRPVLVLDRSRRHGSPADDLAALERELVLGDAVPLLRDLAVEHGPAADSFAAVSAMIDATPGPVVATSAVGAVDFHVTRPVVRLRWTVPDTAVRRALWARTLGDAIPEDPRALDEVAVRYRLGAGGIAHAVASAQATRRPPRRPRLELTELVAGVRHNIAEGIAGLASRVDVTQGWDDLVLADDTREQIRALISRVRHAHRVLEDWGYRGKLARGTGVAALLSGPPGTGKTMVAGLVARELDLELYQVDLSQVVSKWIGETEKQLARIFDAAEAGHALLLFDEADALFGQRTTETKQAVDRYANLEVNFLLQRIEAFGGITILTTNLDAAIDRALRRRLAAHIVFATPDEDERAELWRRLTATGSAPVDDELDCGELSRAFPQMTGANIRNAALAAAFLAASEGSASISQGHLLRAGRAEYRSMGHILAERPGLR